MMRFVRSRILIAAAIVAIMVTVRAAPGSSRGEDDPPPTTQAERDDQVGREADLAAIRKVSDSLIKAFEAGDARAMADLWTTEGEFIADSGATVRGRATLVDRYTGFFKENPRVRLDLEPESVRFVAREAAVAEGFATLHRGPSEAATTSRYSMLLAREEGRWRIALLREWPSEDASLRELAWLVGTWESKEGESRVRSTYEWEGNKAFLRSRFTIERPDGARSGSQMIGKDPTTGRLRAWTFESEGGFGEGTWSRDGNRWLADSIGTHPDGHSMSATNILTRIDDDTFTWQSINRSLDDDALPDLPPVKVIRVKSAK